LWPHGPRDIIAAVVGRQRGPAPVVAAVDSGTARLVPDTDRRAAWTLLIDGAPQSYVDLDDPTHLRFEYMRRLASVIDAAAADGAPLDVLHLGGGALTLARYVAATRPGSHQRAVEHDRAITELVRRALPLPRRADVRVRAADARAATESLGTARFDLVIGDVYRDGRMPRTVASTDFAAQVARVLRPTGWYAVNVADRPPLAFTRTQAATLRAVFAEVAAIADRAVLRGRRAGNVVLVAGARPPGLPVPRLATEAGRDPQPGRLLHGADLDRFIAGAQPATDATAEDSPPPPPGLFR
jgi:hypothetical protein